MKKDTFIILCILVSLVINFAGIMYQRHVQKQIKKINDEIQRTVNDIPFYYKDEA